MVARLDGIMEHYGAVGYDSQNWAVIHSIISDFIHIFDGDNSNGYGGLCL